MRRLLPILFVLLSVSYLAAQSSVKGEWAMVFDKCALDKEALTSIAPHFPDLNSIESERELDQAVKNWRQKYSSEWGAMNSRCSIENTYSLVHLGLYSPEEFEAYVEGKFTHAWVEWYDASGMSDKRLNELAPHFPLPADQATAEDIPAYNDEFEMWRVLYGHEYEALLNAPEMTALNPYYEGYVDAVGFPKFLRALQTDEFPEFVDTGNAFFDRLHFELNKQTWYFIYQPNVFKREYGFTPEFPEGFDAEAFRAAVINRIELNKQIEAGEIEAESDF